MTGYEITSLERWGEKGWKWEAVLPPVAPGMDPQVVTARTNEDGEGLFGLGSDGTWGQGRGTLQFQLPDDREAALRAIRQHYAAMR